jgi:hypothetical protein
MTTTHQEQHGNFGPIQAETVDTNTTKETVHQPEYSLVIAIVVHWEVTSQLNGNSRQKCQIKHNKI